MTKRAGLDLVLKNFRPVNNLPFISKVTEKAALQQLLDHCENHEPLPKFQSGFRTFHSKENPVLKVQNDILLHMDNKEVPLRSRHQLAKTTIESIVVGEYSIKPSENVRNLGSWFDAQMRVNVHIGKTCSKAFHGLYKIRPFRKFLNINTTKTLVHAFVSSHLDFCNVLLFGLPKYQLDRLQKFRTRQLELFFYCQSLTTLRLLLLTYSGSL